MRRIEAAIVEFVPRQSLAPVIDALQAVRGVRLINATTIMVELGDPRRFESGSAQSAASVSPRLAMEGRVTHLIESAWPYRHLPSTSKR
jgi:hypothetical protein